MILKLTVMINRVYIYIYIYSLCTQPYNSSGSFRQIWNTVPLTTDISLSCSVYLLFAVHGVSCVCFWLGGVGTGRNAVVSLAVISSLLWGMKERTAWATHRELMVGAWREQLFKKRWQKQARFKGVALAVVSCELEWEVSLFTCSVICPWK